MASEPLGDIARLDINNHEVQTTVERTPANFWMADHDGPNYDDQGHIIELPEDAERTHLSGMPLIASFRLNLIALSQKYNMHFAAYMDTIHVTRLRTLQQILPGIPDLILRLPISKHQGPGYIDVQRPHSLNNILIGNLGDKEILLFSSDDGDVTAYYTYLIAEELQSIHHSTTESIPISKTKPFFLENVGDSAWGLAIHQKSRLIAVSSNKKEVTVFVHGTSPSVEQEAPNNHNFASNSITTSGYCYFQMEDCRASCLFSDLDPKTVESESLNSHMFSRSFRIVISVGHGCENIPSIAFADGYNGLADSIVATDIRGDLWLLGIWNGKKEKLRGAPEDENRQSGWGILIIPLQNFRHATDFRGALGLLDLNAVLRKRPGNDGGDLCFDITQRRKDIEQHPRLFRRLKRSHHLAFVRDEGSFFNQGDDSDDADDDDDEDDDFLRRGLVSDEPVIKDEEGEGESEYSAALSDAEFFGRFSSVLDIEYGVAATKNLARMVAQFREDNLHIQSLLRASTAKLWRKPILKNGAAILHTSETSIQLMSSFSNIPKTICPEFLSPRASTRFGGHPFGLSRLCMLFQIPELSLVVVASQNGRVALLTLTRPDVSNADVPITTFRLEAFLPPSPHPILGPETVAPLLGIAASPLQQSGSIELENKYPRRFRFIMQYWDHTIWTYELSRDEKFDLKVF